MGSQLKLFFTDLLTSTYPFRDSITHILMKSDDSDRIAVAAKSRDGSISIRGKTQKPIKEFQHVACLGSLPYLHSVFSSPYVKKADDLNIKLNYETASDGKSEALRSMEIKGKRGLHVFYQAVDPFVNQLNRIKIPTTADWPVLFGIDKSTIDAFTEMRKISMQVPKTGSDRDDIFQLIYSEGEIIAVFGEKGHQADITLTEAEPSEEIDKLSALFSITQFRSILDLVGSKGAVAYFSSKALRIDTETDVLSYEFVTSAKRLAE